MTYTYVYQNYKYVHGDVSLNFDAAEFHGSTRTSQYPVLTNEIDSAVIGSDPSTLTLKGRFLPSDFDAVRMYISDNTGKVIQSFTLNGVKYSDMVLLKGSAVMDISHVLGDMVLIFQSV